MSNNNQTRSAVKATPGDGTTAPPAIPSPTLTRHQQVAGNLEDNRRGRPAHPGFPDRAFLEEGLHPHANVPTSFLATTVGGPQAAGRGG